MTNPDIDTLFCPACSRLARLATGNLLNRAVCAPCYELHAMQLEDGEGGPTSVEDRISEWDAMAEHYGEVV